MRTRPVVVLGLLGSTLDAGTGPKRWERWRPTVSLCQQDDLLISRFVLLYQQQFATLLERVRNDLKLVSPQTVVEAVPLELKDPWDFEEVYQALHRFSMSYELDAEREDYLIHITTGTHVAQICLFLLTESRHLPGKLLQTQPPAKDDSGPGRYAIVDLDLSRYDAIATRLAEQRDEDLSFLKAGIVTRNARFNGMIRQIETVALKSPDPILLIGPTGAGKSQLAKRIFELRKARHQLTGPFVELNCATVRGDAAMSTLFGHVKGAFTGAAADRAGLLKSADGGLLFLDEIGELGSDEQAMLLRAIEEKSFFPLGSDKPVSSNFHLIAATNRALRTAAAEGRFRDDLLARIDLWTFELPGLAERREDIEPNLEYELERFATKHGKKVSFNREARTRFLSFALTEGSRWLGNFRDLNAAVTRMGTLAPGGRIRIEEVEEEIQRLSRSWSAGREEHRERSTVSARPLTATPPASLPDHSLTESLDLFERVQLEEVLRVCRASESLSDAGRQLFSVTRSKRATPNDADRLRKYLARFNLRFQDIR